MNTAIYIQRISQLRFVDALSSSCFIQRCTSELLVALKKHPIKRLYFGSEICEEIIPNKKQIDIALQIAADHELAFTFVTPPCTNAGFKRAIEILNYLSQKKQHCEVVCNDFGLAQFIAQARLDFELIYGRLLSKSTKWPLGILPPHALESIRHTPFALKEHQKLLFRMKVKRVELDNRQEGYDQSLDELPFLKTLHIPFVYLTSGRVCFLAGRDKKPEEKFAATQSCDRLCYDNLLLFNNIFYCNGRAIYYLNYLLDPTEMQRFDRLVLSPSL